MNIVLTGSLGNIGKPLATSLAKNGHRVTVVSSNPEKKPAIEALGATAAIGSVADADFLAKAFEGADAVFTMVPPNYGEMDQIAYYSRTADNYAKAVRQAGVKRVVNLSSYGAHLDRGTGFILGAYHTEQILNGLPETVSVTQLRPGYFYYNLNSFIGMLRSAGIIGANYGGGDLMPLVAPVDIAAAAAEELTAADAGSRTVRYVVSDEKSADEVAAAIGERIGKPGLKWLVFTDAEAQAGMEQAGVPAPIAANYTELGHSMHSGDLVAHYKAHRPAKMGAVKLDEALQDFVAAYEAKAPASHGG